MVAEVRASHATEWAAMRAVSELLGIGTTETVRKWVRQAEIDDGSRPAVSTEQSAEPKRINRANAELKRANRQIASGTFFIILGVVFLLRGAPYVTRATAKPSQPLTPMV